MFRFIIFTALVASVLAGYGQNYGSNSYRVGYLSSVGPIQAAVQSRRFLSIVDAPSTYSDNTPLNIDVAPSVSPINFLLRSKSSPLNVQSLHEGSPGSYASSSSVDAPHVRRHDVYRPVIQQLNEVVQPFRSLKQYVRPTEEVVEQVVARGYQQPQKLAYAPLQLLRLQQAPLFKSGYGY